MAQKHGFSQRLVSTIEKSDSTGLGIELARICLKRGYTVGEVAEVLKVSRQTVYNWFSGRLRPRHSQADKVKALIQQLQQAPTNDE